MTFSGSAEQWNAFFLRQPSQVGIFLQSWEWGEFMRSRGERVYRFVLDGVHVQVFEKKLAFGFVFWYVPRAFLNGMRCVSLCKLARDFGAVFVRIESMSDVSFGDCVDAASVQPHHTHVVSLDDEELMLARMHAKTRYNIRLAQRKGVEVVFSKSYVDDFVRLMHVTSDRNRFGIHGDVYYRSQIAQDHAQLVVGIYEGHVIAAHVYWIFGDTLTYVHGASANDYRQVMAPYLVHGEAMQWARDRGVKRCDLWGIDEARWPDLTAFKRRFGGEDVSYSRCVEFPVRTFWYRVYRFIQCLRRR